MSHAARSGKTGEMHPYLLVRARLPLNCSGRSGVALGTLLIAASIIHARCLHALREVPGALFSRAGDGALGSARAAVLAGVASSGRERESRGCTARVSRCWRCWRCWCCARCSCCRPLCLASPPACPRAKSSRARQQACQEAPAHVRRRFTKHSAAARRARPLPRAQRLHHQHATRPHTSRRATVRHVAPTQRLRAVGDAAASHGGRAARQLPHRPARQAVRALAPRRGQAAARPGAAAGEAVAARGRSRPGARSDVRGARDRG